MASSDQHPCFGTIQAWAFRPGGDADPHRYDSLEELAHVLAAALAKNLLLLWGDGGASRDDVKVKSKLLWGSRYGEGPRRTADKDATSTPNLEACTQTM